ncbi:MAG: hypothetical protein IBX69_05200 [Anaerolineales bacterium]|nr:hypothetical protein [Anaerolineales bacterium]
MADSLALSGWDVDLEVEDGSRAFSQIKQSQPRCVVVSLARLPSHGRQTALVLRTSAATRHIPILFVDGKAAAVELALEIVPTALHTTHAELRIALSNLGMQEVST